MKAPDWKLWKVRATVSICDSAIERCRVRRGRFAGFGAWYTPRDPDVIKICSPHTHAKLIIDHTAHTRASHHEFKEKSPLRTARGIQRPHIFSP